MYITEKGFCGQPQKTLRWAGFLHIKNHSLLRSVERNGKTPAATSTPSPAATQLFIYGKYIGGGGSKTLQYTLNGGSPIEIGSIDTTSCLIVTTLSGLSNGDTIVFSEVNTRGVAGSLTNPCPDSGFLCSYTVNIVTGANYVYLTIDSDNVC